MAIGATIYSDEPVVPNPNPNPNVQLYSHDTNKDIFFHILITYKSMNNNIIKSSIIGQTISNSTNVVSVTSK